MPSWAFVFMFAEKPLVKAIDECFVEGLVVVLSSKDSQVIAAEGEKRSSTALKEAADVLMDSPLALQLRYLQTLSAISAEKNSTIIFPFPLGLVQSLLRKD
ncbi:unnamed protein product [Mesocestoides corti]|uniref:Band 7 domain-containing protein n=1 Tax=Mesocestoides corti TaxID=53468 RepID=A0A0R3UMY5_MESCO|nr:unnamed protein product [Mesocestoides corti]